MIMKNIRHELHIALTAWMYFVRVPVPKRLADKVSFSQHSLESSARYFTLVGVMVGLVSGLVFLAALELFASKPLAILLSMAASIVMTGAFHEDGTADFFDAFGGGWWSRERILEIMKDSRIGTFGSVALILMLLIKFQSLLLIPNGMMLIALVGGHALSRLAAGSFLFTHRYVRENDKSYFKPMLKDKGKLSDFVLMAGIGVVPLFFMGSLWYLLVVPILALVTWSFGKYFTSKIGGYTGDCLGATQQIVEVCFYLSLVLVAKHLAL